MATYGFYVGQPWWLLSAVVAVPLLWLSRRHLRVLGKVRRTVVMVLRCLVVALLAVLLARPTLTRRNETLTLITVLDRSQSVPENWKRGSVAYLKQAVTGGQETDRLAVIDVAEAAVISQLPSLAKDIRRRNVSLAGTQTTLAGGLQLAMAIAPPDSATRILLVSDGNETEGDVKEAARLAAANGIPIDVLPLMYAHDREVVLSRLVAPSRVRSGQTIPLRFVLKSTAGANGRLLLALNGQPVDLDPGSEAIGAEVTLTPGTNVKTVAIPVGTRGVHEFQAVFVPDPPGGDGIRQDNLTQNNRASAITLVAGPGHILIVDTDGRSGEAMAKAVRQAGLAVRYAAAVEVTDDLTKLLGTDAVVLVNTDASQFSQKQQQMFCRYVTDLGGGLVMVGGPDGFGAGGWIGSPVAEVLPINLDPPQKQYMPKGALVLIMHACEMPNGNLWGKRTAIAAVKALSRLDLVGVLDYSWGGGMSNWVYPLSPAGDKKAVISAIQKMAMGDMPDFAAPMRAAVAALKKSTAGQKHVIIISDGDPSPPSPKLLLQCKQSGITVTGVAVFPHSPKDVKSLALIAKYTGGRFYNVKDPKRLPRIFVKEAKIVRRAMILEEPFTPAVSDALSEIIRGLDLPLPELHGYVLSGPKGGLSQDVLQSEKGDPLLATGQFGLGRSVAFTSSADAKWAAQWLAWGGYGQFWEQTVRWASRPGQRSDFEVFADVHGREVDLVAEAVGAGGKPVALTDVAGQVIGPEMSTKPLILRQVGPGQYRAKFLAVAAGSYLVNLRSKRRGVTGPTAVSQVQVAVTVPYAPEFRDLSTNVPLLAQIAQITGGRIIAGPPDKAALFARDGVKFPETAHPLTQHVIIVLLGVFLLDVAIRRIALDFPAMGRRIAGVFRRRKATVKDAKLERLKSRRREVREELDERGREDISRRRYEADEESDQELPPERAGPDQASSRKPAPADAEDAPPAAKKPAASEGPVHLQRLLRAKRRFKDRLGETDGEKE